MGEIMYELYYANALIETEGDHYATKDAKERLKDSVLNNILAKYNVNRPQWDSSLIHYSYHIRDYLHISDSVKARFKKEMKEAKLLEDSVSNLQDKCWKQVENPSYIPENIFLSTHEGHDHFSFRLDSIKIRELIKEKNVENNICKFSFRSFGFLSPGRDSAECVLIGNYKDTTLLSAKKIFTDSIYSLYIPRFISGDSLKSLAGYLKFKRDPKSKMEILFYQIHTSMVADSTSGKRPRIFDLIANPQKFYHTEKNDSCRLF